MSYYVEIVLTKSCNDHSIFFGEGDSCLFSVYEKDMGLIKGIRNNAALSSLKITSVADISSDLSPRLCTFQSSSWFSSLPK